MKIAAEEERVREGVFFCNYSKSILIILRDRKTARVKVKSKAIPTIFLKIKGKRTFVEAKERKKGAVRRMGR